MPELNQVQGKVFAVTGGTGFVGRRVCELLLERGAKRVIAFDICPPNASCSPASDSLVYQIGNLTIQEDVEKMLEGGVDCVFHIAALVGPYHEYHMYEKVNYHGTLNVINACRKHNVGKCVMSSSPSTRFDGNDMLNLREEDMEIRKPGKFLQPYAETKAMGEIAMRAANDDERFLTVCIAPHQVYGPGDALFLPNIIAPCRTGRLRAFGSAKNMVSFTHVDNYSHALILGYQHLYLNSPVLGKYYMATDGEPQYIWERINQLSLHLGYGSVLDKIRIPYFLIMGIAYLVSLVGFLVRKKFKLSPFSVKMLMIHRTFDITNITRDMNYKPLLTFDEGWAQTLNWFAEKEAALTRKQIPVAPQLAPAAGPSSSSSKHTHEKSE